MSDNYFLPQPFPPFPPQQGGGNGAKPLTSWERLAEGKTIGKSTNLVFESGAAGGGGQAPNQSAVDILNVQGSDRDAMQFCLTIGVPEQYPLAALPSGVTIDNLSGSADNIDLVVTQFGGSVGGLVTGVGTNEQFANPVAIVEWGAGGAQHRVECDIINGLCLNLSGSFARVRAFCETNFVAPGFANGFYRATATLSPGYPKANNAQRTVMCQTLPAINAESGVYTVPRFAKSITLVGATLTATNVFVGTVRFYRGPNIANNTYVASYVFSGNNAQQFPIPNGAYYFTFIPGIADTTVMQAIFQLSV
jgi:hypothetical protein